MERAAGSEVQLVSVVVQQMNSVAVDMCELIEVCGNEVVDSALKPRFSLVTLLLNCAGFSWCVAASQCLHTVSTYWTGVWLWPSLCILCLRSRLCLPLSLTAILTAVCECSPPLNGSLCYILLLSVIAFCHSVPLTTASHYLLLTTASPYCISLNPSHYCISTTYPYCLSLLHAVQVLDDVGHATAHEHFRVTIAASETALVE